MKLEYIKSTSGYDKDVIRIFDFDPSQAFMFLGMVNRFLAKPEAPLHLTDLSFIRSVNCSLTLRTAEQDAGISTEDHIHFYCDLTVEKYKEIESLLGTFCKKRAAVEQPLYSQNAVQLLLSPSKN